MDSGVTGHDADRRRLHLRVHGRVQGVGFRYFVRAEALRLGLTGWVRNCFGGEVEIVAEGPRASLEQFVAIVRQGPPMAWVQRADADWSDHRGGFASFEVTHSV